MSSAKKPKKTKLKTHKGAQRRFSVTSTGKIMRPKGMKSHFRRRKSPRVLRQLDRMQEMHESDTPRVKKMIPWRLAPPVDRTV